MSDHIPSGMAMMMNDAPTVGDRIRALEAELSALKSECDLLRPNARRYEWLRSSPWGIVQNPSLVTNHVWFKAENSELDAAIDAAMTLAEKG